MTAITVHRTHVPFWPTVLLAAVAWLIAWIVNLPLANWAAYDLLDLQPGTQLGDAVAFFLYDVPKVLLLLTGIVTVVSFMRSYVSPERVRSALAGTWLTAGHAGCRRNDRLAWYVQGGAGSCDWPPVRLATGSVPEGPRIVTLGTSGGAMREAMLTMPNGDLM